MSLDTQRAAKQVTDSVVVGSGAPRFEVGPLANSFCAGNPSLPVLVPLVRAKKGAAQAVRE